METIILYTHVSYFRLRFKSLFVKFKLHKHKIQNCPKLNTKRDYPSYSLNRRQNKEITVFERKMSLFSCRIGGQKPEFTSLFSEGKYRGRLKVKLHNSYIIFNFPTESLRISTHHF